MTSKNVLAINLGNFGSTGMIARQILNLSQSRGFITYFAYAGWPNNNPVQEKDILICSSFFRKVFSKLVAYSGLNGCFSILHTLFFLRKVEKIGVDLIHFHNLHNSYINLPMLMRFVKKKRIPIIWTLHDCWAFTGRCPYFDFYTCGKWKIGCCDCVYPKKEYPQSFVDTSKMMWTMKKKMFTGIENCTIVTPSLWLAGLVKQSYLKDYSIKVINNGIDLEFFKPTDSIFRKKFNLQNKNVVLGVAFGWGCRKGLDVFVALSKKFSKEYQIVLVGTDDSVDKQLPSNIISIHRTQNQKELAEIYSAADVFVNPTREENYPTVNMEALACGTPVVTFRTGGSPEIVDETCGFVVDCDDVNSMAKNIRYVCENHPFSQIDCLTRAKNFNKDCCFDDYVKLYREILEK